MAFSARLEARGLALVGASALAYGVMPILGKIAYGAGVEPLPLLAWRYLIAAALITAIERRASLPLATRLRLWALGAVFVFNSVAYFRALELVPASVISIVVYTYPMLVALLAAVVAVEPLTLRALTAAIAAFAGCALVAGGVGAEGRPSLAGVAWTLAAAFGYACYVVLSSRFAAAVPARLLALHVVQVAGVVCVALSFAGAGPALPRDPVAWLSVFAIAVVSTVIALTTFLAGMAVIGPTRASVLSSVEVIFTLALAFVFLGETLSVWQWLGGLLILGAVAWQNLGVVADLVRGGE